jgi:hypothetical protein
MRTTRFHLHASPRHDGAKRRTAVLNHTSSNGHQLFPAVSHWLSVCFEQKSLQLQLQMQLPARAVDCEVHVATISFSLHRYRRVQAGCFVSLGPGRKQDARA